MGLLLPVLLLPLLLQCFRLPQCITLRTLQRGAKVPPYGTATGTESQGPLRMLQHSRCTAQWVLVWLGCSISISIRSKPEAALHPTVLPPTARVGQARGVHGR